MTESDVAPPPGPGEIWQDSEGTLLYIASSDRVYSFGTAGSLKIEHLREQWRPSKRMFDRSGRYVGGGGLDYPNGHVEGVRDCPCGSSVHK